MMRNIYLSSVLLCFFSNAMASWYLGGGLGRTDYDADSISRFDDPVGIELILGNDINSNFSFEVSYIDFGEANDGLFPNWRLNADGLTLAALIKAPVNKDFNIFFKVGLNDWDITLKQDGLGVIAKDAGTDIFYGVGAAVNVNDKVSLGARYNVYDFDGNNHYFRGFNSNVTMLSLNLFVSF